MWVRERESEDENEKMSRCEDEKMWRWADAKMSRCEDEQMWRWEGVKMRMRRCEDEQMWRCADVKMSRCEDEKVWRWEGVKMSRCEDEKVWEKVWRWEGVKMSRCEDEKMWRWADVKMSRCEDEQMWRWEGVKMRMRRCADEQMWRWADVKMSRCEDEKVWRWEGVKIRRCEDEKVWEKVWRWEGEKMRRWDTDPPYWKNPALRRSREKSGIGSNENADSQQISAFSNKHGRFIEPSETRNEATKDWVSLMEKIGSWPRTKSCTLEPKHIWLVVSTPLKNISQLGLLFPIWKNKKCSKPPTRYITWFELPNHCWHEHIYVQFTILDYDGLL